MAPSEAKPFVIELRGGRLYAGGDLSLEHGRQIWRDLQQVAAGVEGRKLDIDLTEVENLDGAAAALLVDLRARLADRGVSSEFLGASAHVASLVTLYAGYRRPMGPRGRRHFGVVEHLGERVRSAARSVRGMLEFLGVTVVAAAAALVRPIGGKRRSIPPLVADAGVDAIPLVLLLNFLLGFVMAYDSSRQLESFGAQVYIADVVGIAVTRELSPVMTSIIVLGRSAAAYTAELGTMKVSEELDALYAMGFAPVRHLVLPRVLALLVVTPALTLFGDVAGVSGGVLVGITKLDVTPHAYLAELRRVVVLGDVLGGLLKAGVIGVTIAFIGSRQGFATSGGPAGVGLRTTSTVVKSLVALVLIDAFFAVFLGAIRR